MKKKLSSVCVFHKLSHPAFLTGRKKQPKAFVSFNLLELLDERLTDSLAVLLLE